MRVIGGTFGGRRLLGPPRGTETRPTTDRVREAIFNVLGPRVEGARVLDLFAGTGALGIEALSRGAARALFVERDRAVAALIRSNLASTGLASRARVRELGLPAGLPALAADEAPFDLVLIDAPYEGSARDEVLMHPALRALLAPGGCVVVEHDARHAPPLDLPGFEVTDQRRYGSTGLVFLEHPAPSSEDP